MTQCRRRPHPGSRAQGRRRWSQQDQTGEARRQWGRGRRSIRGEGGPRNRRMTIGKRTGGRTEGWEEPLWSGGREAAWGGGF